ncbi:MAG: tetratricopeptide repeat protein [Burkholderiales bacterium]
MTARGANCSRPAPIWHGLFSLVAAAWMGIAVGADPVAPPAAGAPATPRPNPISEPGRLWAFDGFALQPPGGGEWYSLVKSRDEAVFARRAIDRSYTLIAVVHAAHIDDPPTTPDDLAALVRGRAPRVPDSDRYEILERAVELDPSASWCVRYRLRAEDSRESFFYPHIIRIAGRVCAHPGEPDLLIDASYAERAVEGETNPEALEEGEAFLAGVRLTPLYAAAITRADSLIASGSAEEAVRLLSPLAEQGYAPAAQMLGAAYEQGKGVPPDADAATRWYRIAADAGEVDALYNLGALHDHTNGSVRDAQEALRWFLRAADQRDAQAQLNLGMLYMKGDGVAQDTKRARYWLELAGSNGNARARTLLRTLFP